MPAILCQMADLTRCGMKYCWRVQIAIHLSTQYFTNILILLKWNLKTKSYVISTNETVTSILMN